MVLPDNADSKAIESVITKHLASSVDEISSWAGKYTITQLPSQTMTVDSQIRRDAQHTAYANMAAAELSFNKNYKTLKDEDKIQADNIIREELKEMILRQVDDLIENCYVKEWGLFYYKELPTLKRLGNNTLLLEALTYAYDLSGDAKYLTYGIETFKNALEDRQGYSSTKRKIEDTVLVGNASAKIFAQSMIPLSIYYRALAESDTDYR
jgi:hypothetical protein